MSSRFGGLIPLFLAKKSLYPFIKTSVEICLFYGGLVIIRWGLLSVWELLILGLAVGCNLALLISRYRFFKQEQFIWKLGSKSFLIPSSGLLLMGWYLWRWWHLADLLLKAGLVPFLVSFVLFLDYLEREFNGEMVALSQKEAIFAFLHRFTFFLFPPVLAVVFKLLNL
jgi:hypothetical protein